MRPSNLGWLDPFGSAKVRVSLSRTVLSVPPTLASSKSSSRSQSTSPPRIKTSPPPPGQNETSVFVQSHTFVPPWLGGRIWSYLRRPSIDVNFDFRRWSKHRSPFRHLRQWLPQNIIRSVDIRRVIFPDVIQVGLTASLITWYNGTLAAKTLEVLDTNGDGDVSMEELRAGIEQNLVEAHCGWCSYENFFFLSLAFSSSLSRLPHSYYVQRTNDMHAWSLKIELFVDFPSDLILVVHRFSDGDGFFYRSGYVDHSKHYAVYRHLIGPRDDAYISDPALPPEIHRSPRALGFP